MNHSVDVNKMACRHNAPEPILGTRSVCAHCGVAIQADGCRACDGYGRAYHGGKCFVCRGTGIDRWEEVP